MCRRLRRKLCKRDAKRTVLEEAQSRSGDGRQSKRGRQRPGAAGLETLVDRAHAHHEFRGRVGDRKTTMPATQGFSTKTQASGMAQSLGNERGTTEGEPHRVCRHSLPTRAVNNKLAVQFADVGWGQKRCTNVWGVHIFSCLGYHGPGGLSSPIFRPSFIPHRFPRVCIGRGPGLFRPAGRHARRRPERTTHSRRDPGFYPRGQVLECV